ncbi:hypothetical protein AKJ48_03565 [candidate division MSBL1 archaeon SCGC-AAA261O19]|uniref:Uncharacterized protein n=1 Tax=candidate division MSBL1 archaeon SCGC-AAA261O19 TaxID=1698277 RepID=A0A133VBX9_9EURY|nr:hypothetical protein AKJ48_03565 [candidate division MSBL1 archaeon SCGC-AAA261O19]
MSNSPLLKGLRVSLCSFWVIPSPLRNFTLSISQIRLLEKQPFEILLLDMEVDNVESLFELRKIIPRLFQTKDMRLEEEALDDLTRRPNCAKIVRAILNLGDSPDTVTDELVERVAEYMKMEDEPPENLKEIEILQEEEEAKSYVENPAERRSRKVIK